MKHFTLVASLGLVLPLSAQVTDGGFEGGAGSGAWTEASTNFGTPLCDAACGTCGGPCAPRTGAWYVWYGGAGGATETGSVEQSATIPTGPDVRLLLYVKVALSNGLVDDRVEVSVDGTILETVTALDTLEFGDYALLNVDVNAYANGAAHTIKIEGFQTTANVSNILVDDVELVTDGGSIGLFENENLPGIMVYPNPANGTINLSFNALQGEAVVTITDLAGKLVNSDRLAEVNRRIYQFDASELNNGAYTVTVEMGGKRFTERVVVAH